jgi:hypothetical protein
MNGFIGVLLQLHAWTNVFSTSTIGRSVIQFRSSLPFSIFPAWVWIWVLYYDRRSVGQSVLEYSTLLCLTTRFLLLSESFEFVDMGRSIWREDGNVIYNCCWSSPAQSFSGPSPVGLETIFYCLRFETSLFVASYDSQGYGGGILTLLHTGFWPDCSPFYNSRRLTHGAEPFLKICQLCSYSRTSQHFMEPGVSLPCSREPSTGPYPEPDQSNPYHPIPLRSLLILSTHLRLGLSSGLFPSGTLGGWNRKYLLEEFPISYMR